MDYLIDPEPTNRLWSNGPWTWTVAEDQYAKSLEFGGGLGWIDNDDIGVGPDEHEANKIVLAFAPLLASALAEYREAEHGVAKHTAHELMMQVAEQFADQINSIEPYQPEDF